MKREQEGLGAVAAVMLLVVLASAAAAMLRLGQSSQTASAQDVQGERASLAARAGTEWGLYQALKGSWSSCSGASQTLDLVADTGMRVTVSCTSSSYNEGESVPGTPQVVRVYTIDAVACNATASCPDAAAAGGIGYVERRRQVQVTD
jgi:MSHA biogenesis protein MshP